MMETRIQRGRRSWPAWATLALPALLCATGVGQTIRRVDPSAQGPVHNGNSWPTAFLTLQDALDQAPAAGDEIWVAAGTYMPSVEHCVVTNCMTMSEHKTFLLPDGVGIYGGFLGNAPGGGETLRSQRDPERNVTILSGDLLGDDDPADSGTLDDNAVHVVTADSVSDTTVLSGFTITAGHAKGIGCGANPNECPDDPDNFAGGLLVYAGSGQTSSPQITRCVFIDNTAPFGGGATAILWLNVTAGPPTRFVNCDFLDNSVKGTDTAEGCAACIAGLRLAASRVPQPLPKGGFPSVP